MKVSLIKIGNSKGVRLPKYILDEYKFMKNIELITVKEGILLKPIIEKKPREGWAERFAAAGPDENYFASIEDDSFNQEWQW